MTDEPRPWEGAEIGLTIGEIVMLSGTWWAGVENAALQQDARPECVVDRGEWALERRKRLLLVSTWAHDNDKLASRSKVGRLEIV